MPVCFSPLHTSRQKTIRRNSCKSKPNHRILYWYGCKLLFVFKLYCRIFSKKLCDDLVWIYSCFSIIVFCLLVCKGKSKLALKLSALILAVLFNMCFVYGCWYFNAKSVLEVIVFIIGLIVLRRDTLSSSALMGTISIVLAVLLDMVIPFHFG